MSLFDGVMESVSGLAHNVAEVGAHALSAPGQLAANLGGVGDYFSGIRQEGLRSILDVDGVVDRQRAQRELRDRFQIVDPENAGLHAGNQITEEEFHNVARMYSDIRMGEGDLQFGSGAAAHDPAYRAQTMDQIGRILQTSSGRQLIAGLHDTSDPLLEGGDARHAHLRTSLDGFDVSPELSGGAHQASTLDRRAHREEGGGAGHGSDTHVQTMPTDGAVTLPPGLALPGWSPRSDVVLYHELTHALHAVRGEKENGRIHAGETADDAVARAEDVGVEREEYQTVFGSGSSLDIDENNYRRERAAIARIGQGAIAGDREMAQRTSYLPDGTHAAVARLREQQAP